MLQQKSVVRFLRVLAMAWLSLFLFQNTGVPLLHEHEGIKEQEHAASTSVQMHSDCWACDLDQFILQALPASLLYTAYVLLLCWGALRFPLAVLFAFTPFTFSSLRAPPLKHFEA